MLSICSCVIIARVCKLYPKNILYACIFCEYKSHWLRTQSRQTNTLPSIWCKIVRGLLMDPHTQNVYAERPAWLKFNFSGRVNCALGCQNNNFPKLVWFVRSVCVWHVQKENVRSRKMNIECFSSVCETKATSRQCDTRIWTCKTTLKSCMWVCVWECVDISY